MNDGRSRTSAPPPTAAAVEPLERRLFLSTTPDPIAVLLKDINTAGASTTFGQSAQLGDNAILFERNTREIWTTDGTEAGTRLVKSLSILPNLPSASQYWTSVGNQVFFRGYDFQTGLELWKSDGTPEGTRLVKNIQPETSGEIHSAPYALINFKDELYFFAWDSVHGDELWTSDGTEAGTTLLKDIVPGRLGIAREPSPTHGFPPPLFAIVGDTLYFTAVNSGISTSPRELWKTDGTAAGTVMVKRFATGESVQTIANVGGQLVVGVQLSGTLTTELWTDPDGDGTWAATRAPITGFLVEAGPIAFFRGRDGGPAAERGLWRTDGTAAGTVQVKDLPSVSAITHFVPLGDGLITFIATDAQGYAIWRSDGTPQGTTVLRRLILPPISASFQGQPTLAMRYGDEAFYSVMVNAAEGQELYRTDGTPEGTRLVADVKPGPSSSAPRLLGHAGDKFLFAADDGPHGIELWYTASNAAFASLVADITPTNVASSPRDFTRVGNNVFFVATSSEHGTELWKTDGTVAGTMLVKDITPGPASSGPFDLIAMGGRLYFVATDGGTSNALWTSDGTEAGTVIVKDPNPTGQSFVNGAGGSELVATSTHLFFRASDGVHGFEVWASDGTPAGTHMLADIAPGPENTDFPPVSVLNDTIVFAADGDLWTSDGTIAGTTKLKEMGSGSSYPTVSNLTPAPGGTLYFTGTDPRELWRSDGTTGGTTLVTSFNPATQISGLTWFKDRLYFFLTVQGFPNDFVTLQRTDGTPQGTESLGQLPTEASPDGLPYYMKVAGDTLYFIGGRYYESHLWATDGTIAGTRRIDIDPGSAVHPSGVGSLHDYNGTLLFRATSSLTGRLALWSSDGTNAGTRPIHDTASRGTGPDVMDAAPLDGDRLLFSGYDPAIGYEPYMLVQPLHRTITGTDGEDHWTIRNIATDRIGVWRSGTGRDEPPDFEYLKAEVASLTFVGGDGDDTVFISGDASFPMIFDGGAGSDRVGSLCDNDDLTGNFERIDVHDGYHLTILGQFDLESILLTAQGKLILKAGSNTTVRTRSLTMEAGDVLDVNDNTLIVEGADLATIEALVRAGRARDAGITSALARSNPLAGLATFRGEENEIVVKYTYDGDANGDGRINADDYFKIDSGFLAQAASPRYEDGDFNYDDKVNADDYFLIDSAFLGAASVGTELHRMSAPTADAGTSYTVAPGGVVELDGTGSFDPDPNETLSYAWDLDDDGVFGELGADATRGDELGPTVEFPAEGLAEGTYPVKLRVTNSAGLSDEATADVVVQATQVGVQTVVGDETEADQWTVRYSLGNVQVYRRFGSSLVLEEEWPSSEVRELRFVGGGGDDRVSVFSTLPLTKIVLEGGEGTDTLLYTADNDEGVGGSFERLEVYGGTSLLLSESLATDVVELGEGSRLTLAAGGIIELRTRQLLLEPLFADTLDLNDNRLLVEQGNAAALEALVAASRNATGGAWTGPGITSTPARTQSLRGVGVTSVGSDVLVSYGYDGDANGDGRVNADDYFRIDSGFLDQPQGPLFAQGDFNFDDRINADDYFLIDSAFLGQTQPAATGAVAATAGVASGAVESSSVRKNGMLVTRRGAEPFQTRHRVVAAAARRTRP